jgi:phosphoglycolate phosphatase
MIKDVFHMSQKIKAIIFDMDGTVLDTLDDIHDSVNVALQKNSLPQKSKEEVKLALGYGAKRLIQKICPTNISELTLEKVYQNYQDHYDQNNKNETKPYKGIMELLQILVKQYKLAVVSNKHDYLVKPLNSTIFNQIFDPAVGMMEGIPSKPDPKMLINVITEYELNSDEIVFVGDSEIDILTAQNANVYSVGVTWGFRTKEVLIQAKANQIIDHPMELIDVLERINNEPY